MSLRVGPGQNAEIVFDEAERRRFVEPAADQQHGVVGLIVFVIEGLQPRYRHVFDVGARADDGVAVVVPQIGGRGHALAEHVIGAVLARFELVAHHGHLAVQILLRHLGIDHAVGFELQRPVEVALAGSHGLVEIGAVERGRAVEGRAVALKLALDVGMLRRALEQHVLEQVRHAVFAFALVARADEIGDVDRDRIVRRVGEQQHLETVRQPVLGNALDRGDFPDRRRRRGARRVGVRRREQECRQQQGKGQRKNTAQHRDLVCSDQFYKDRIYPDRFKIMPPDGAEAAASRYRAEAQRARAGRAGGA